MLIIYLCPQYYDADLSQDNNMNDLNCKLNSIYRYVDTALFLCYPEVNEIRGRLVPKVY